MWGGNEKLGPTGIALFGLIAACLNSCSLPQLLGYLEFSDLDRTYEFDLPKEELKDMIVEEYSYDMGLLCKNLGRTLIEDPEVNSKYRISTEEWLDKGNWEQHKAEIRRSMGDTTDIHIVKHHSRKAIKFRLIMAGDTERSSLRVIRLTAVRRRKFSKSPEYHREKLIGKVERKFIRKLDDGYSATVTDPS